MRPRPSHHQPAASAPRAAALALLVSARMRATGDLDDGLAFMAGLTLGADGTGGIEHDAKFGYGFAGSDINFGV
jgi:hypothetical protein